MTTRKTTTTPLPINTIGAQMNLVFHRYGPANSTGKAYIQASLHADELPGLLVAHHLIKLLEIADRNQLIQKEIVIVPFANPIGLSQGFLGLHMGRFNLATGVNFNRSFVNVGDALVARVNGKLHLADEAENVRVIREAFRAELAERCADDRDVKQSEDVMKLHLISEACDADIVLDLHCDTDAVMHMYTHDRLWPQLSDLCAFLGSECNIIDGGTGGNCFDEACSTPWAYIADKYPGYAIPMACQSTTVELRGEYDVNDSLAKQDAVALYHFLQHRGYIAEDPTHSLPALPAELPALKRHPSPLTGVDMIKAPAVGVINWNVKPGDIVESGQVLGEVVNIEDPFAPRTPIRTRTGGIVFGMRSHKLSVPGTIMIKVAGDHPLSWRTGNLLTSR